MVHETDYTFDISVSNQGYPLKPGNPGTITFTKQSISIPEFISYIKEGRAFCYNYKSKTDGYITQRDRHKENFTSTSTIFYDMDKMDQPIDDFVSTLEYKPSVSYTTYSNGKDDLYGYRLVYCLCEPVQSETEFNVIYDAISKANSFKSRKNGKHGISGFDRRSVNQMYYGSTPDGLVITNDLIYNYEDFCPYGSFPIKNDIIKEEEKKNTLHSQLEKEDTSILDELNTLGTKGFLDKYCLKYSKGYVESLHTAYIPSEDGSYFLYPEDFQEVFHHWVNNYPVKWQVGEDRKSKLYITGQIMKHNMPGITFDQLLYNFVYERHYYYENTDGKINNRVLADTAKSVLNHDIELKPCKHPSFSVNKEYWTVRGYTLNQAKQFISKRLRWEKLAENYDPDLTINQNLEQLHAMGIKVGKSTLYDLVREMGLKK